MPYSSFLFHQIMKPCIIADNQFITSEGIASLLSNVLQSKIVIRVKTLKDLQEKLKIYSDSIVILDYTLFDFVSAQQLLVVKSASKQSTWLLFSEELGEHFLRHVLISDSSISVVMKHDSQEEILNALESVKFGIPYVCESAQLIVENNESIINTETGQDKLTASEKEILREIAFGKTTKEIAFEKNLSFHTVNSHRKNIFRKLEVNNLHEAIKYAIRSGIFDIAEYYI